ncbi:MAG TPA: hypothetical protein VHG91_03670 [Longimicrobium sp.]|nr:hypothetical protein [Longimicrobium sp.]
MRPALLTPSTKNGGYVEEEEGEMRTLRMLPAVLLVLLMAACAGGRRGTGGETATVVVENNLVVPTSLSVFIVAETGTRTLIGTVPPGNAATLTFRSPAILGSYRLLARTAAGNDIVSNSFALSGGERIDWNLRSNVAVASR